MILGRPDITKDMGSRRFKEFYYTEQELVDFLKANGLDISGGKSELIERICAFIDGHPPEPKFIVKPPEAEEEEETVTAETIIEEDFLLSEKHLNFFRKVIGPEFVMTDDFEQWIITNAGRSYDEAVDAWYMFEEDMF